MARGAGAEEVLVQGMGRTVGWVVAAGAGELAFRDCRGGVSPITVGRLEATTERCSGAGSRVEVNGTVRGADLSGRLLVVEDAGGHIHRFYVAPSGTDGPALSEFASGDAVRVTGPVTGRATGIRRP